MSTVMESSSIFRTLSNESNPEYQFTVKQHTLQELYAKWKDGTLIPRPIEFQRKEVANDAWKGGIVYTALNRTMGLMLHFCEVRLKDGRLAVEVLDGQQRLTSLFQYLDNKKSIYLRTFDNKKPVTRLNNLPIYLTQSRTTISVDVKKAVGIEGLETCDDTYGIELAEQLLRTSIVVVQFAKETSDEVKAEVFGMLNNGNDLNSQEKRNAIRGWLARTVRAMVRSGKGTLTPATEIEPFDIPVSRYLNEGGNGPMSHMQNTRLELEEFVARLFLFEHLENPFEAKTYATDEGMTEMYRDPHYRGDGTPNSDISQDANRACDGIRAKIDRRMAIIEKWIVPPSKNQSAAQFGKFSKQATGSFSHWTTLYLFLMWLDTYHAGWKLGLGASEAFMTAFKKLTVGPNQTNPYSDWNPYNEGTGKSTFFSQLLGKYAPHEIATKCEMLLDAIQQEDSTAIRLLDPRRCFSMRDKVRKWNEQGCRCAYTGQLLSMDEAAAGHKIPHSSGGATTYDNLIVISREINQKMGSLSWNEFLTVFPQKKVA